ncbi:hypothetical protein CGMCC3_g17867 [Colletotrichum fructicola]|nr:uncharacterized protein CGMCC3_g17867 [Colletotrichum fructicola]KAE9565950.1 hypothetical protein CGMCC3_g17867 [Colletotrichum fructicola]
MTSGPSGVIAQPHRLSSILASSGLIISLAPLVSSIGTLPIPRVPCVLIQAANSVDALPCYDSWRNVQGQHAYDVIIRRPLAANMR